MGAMGSGTTLLRLMLDSHERIAIPPETGFMRAYNAHRFIPFKWTGRNWAKRLGWSRRELDEHLRAFYDSLFMKYAREHGKVRWGEKTPLHMWHIDDMARVFPDAVFVGILRHPGGSIASNMNRWRFDALRATDHFERYTRELVRQAARRPRRFALLRYEELLLQPEAAMRELLGWLDEPWSEAVLSHHKVQAGRGGRAVVEGRNRVGEPLDVKRIDRWQKTIDDSTRAAISRAIDPLPELLGYAMNDPATLEPLTGGRALLIRGRHVRARIAAFPGLHLEEQGPVPRFEQLYHPRDWTLEPANPEKLPQQQVDPGLLRELARPIVRRMPLGVRRRLADRG